MIISAADLLVEIDVGCAAQTAALRVLMKDPADKERIIAGVRAEQERLLRSRAGERDEHVGNIFAPVTVDLVRRL